MSDEPADFTIAAPERFAALTRAVRGAILSLDDERPDKALQRLQDGLFADGLLAEQVPALRDPAVVAAIERLRNEMPSLQWEGRGLYMDGDRTWWAQVLDLDTPSGHDQNVNAAGRTALAAVEAIPDAVAEHRAWCATNEPFKFSS